MKKILFALIILAALASCKKESDNKHCWVVKDANTTPVGTDCGKTEAEIKAEFPCGNGGCTYTITD